MCKFKVVPALALSVLFGASAAMAADGGKKGPKPNDGLVTCQAIGCTKPGPISGRPDQRPSQRPVREPVREPVKVNEPIFTCQAIGCVKK